ncbi:MAG: hypothetical protein GY854_09350 [Deltaproteobacteria bacterium]|nr:hypothetical protein [Deltaproteobacteria bacterium]
MWFIRHMSSKRFVYKRFFAVFLTAALSTCLAGCNLKRLVIKSSYVMVEEAMNSFFEEEDTILAAQAAPANLKLIEGMARGDPENSEVQIAAAKLIGMYSFGFLEDCCEDEQEQARADQRAKKLYLRARNYAIRVLQQHVDFKAMMQLELEAFRKELKVFDEEHVPELLWAAFNWGLYINLSRDDISAVADLAKVAAMTERVVELDEGYFYGTAHLFLMVYYGSVGKVLGGDPEKAKEEYEKAWKLSGKKFLMIKYLFAKYYCQQTLDQPLFEKLLKEIINAPEDLLPEQTLSNTLAKQKAARLLKQTEDIF